MQQRHAFAEFVPLSARRQPTSNACSDRPTLPARRPWLHDEDALTDRSERFLASELIREKLFRLTGDELPYTSTVVIEVRRAAGGLRRIAAAIVVEREAHKAIVIGAAASGCGASARRRVDWKAARRECLRRTVGQVRSAGPTTKPPQLRLRVGAARLSMATRPVRAPATLLSFVLHRYDWSRSSSLILDLFTREGPDHRRRRAPSARSPMRAVLLPFQRPRRPGPGRGSSDAAPPEVQTLRSADWAGGATAMLTGAALFAGFHCNELVMKFVARHDPHPRLFDAYAETLTMLSANDDAAAARSACSSCGCCGGGGLLPDLSLVTQTQRRSTRARLALLPEAGSGAAHPASRPPGGVLIALLPALGARQHGRAAPGLLARRCRN